jgi:hypothetical protein
MPMTEPPTPPTLPEWPPKYSRRLWLIMAAVNRGASPHQAREAVASLAIEHPEWDLDERKTWAQWMAEESS